MALESATYLDSLNVSNPAASDAVGQADDHIRMLKAVLQATFPNINGACNATPLQLNYGFVPIGVIAMWSGDPASLPTNWKLCDGTTVAKSDGSGNITLPDLRSKFIKGCGGTNASPSTAPTIATTGGSNGTAVVTVAGTAITQAQLPNCSFTVTDPGHTHTQVAHTHTVAWGSSGFTCTVGASAIYGGNSTTTTSSSVAPVINSNTTGITVASGGSGSTHTHTASVDIDNQPAYYVLAYICKI